MPMIDEDPAGGSRFNAMVQSNLGITTESKVWSLAGERSPSSQHSKFFIDAESKIKSQTDSMQAQQLELPKSETQVEPEHATKTQLSSIQETSNVTVECAVCFNSPPNVVFMPCGHGGACQDCSFRMCEKELVCFICKEPIEAALLVDSNKSKDGLVLVLGRLEL